MKKITDAYLRTLKPQEKQLKITVGEGLTFCVSPKGKKTLSGGFMKRLAFILSCLMMLAFASIAHAETPAILADLNQNYSVQHADDTTLDQAQGATIVEYKVRFLHSNYYWNDPRSRQFRNWQVVSGPTYISTRYSGTWYTSHIGQVIYSTSNSPVSAWCSSY